MNISQFQTIPMETDNR